MPFTCAKSAKTGRSYQACAEEGRGRGGALFFSLRNKCPSKWLKVPLTHSLPSLTTISYHSLWSLSTCPSKGLCKALVPTFFTLSSNNKLMLNREGSFILALLHFSFKQTVGVVNDFLDYSIIIYYILYLYLSINKNNKNSDYLRFVNYKASLHSVLINLMHPCETHFFFYK